MKLECFVPSCDITTENVSKCGRITFYGFPSTARLRAAWLRALGKQDCQLPDCAVVCSQHFLHDDVCETESGSRQLRPGAVPSTVLVCMICLDTDSKMSRISQYNLEAAYEKLTGHPLWDGGYLKQTLCVQCAQRLRNFSRFREQSLRARSLMMELLEKHELITIEHIKMIQHANNKLQNNLVSITLGPDPCDMYIVENTDKGRQADSEEPVFEVAVKIECSDDSQSVDEDKQEINIEILPDPVNREFEVDPLKYESSAFVCTVCGEEFPHEYAYSAHVRMHGDAYHAADNRALASNHRTKTDLKSYDVELYDILKYPESAKIKIEPSPQALQAVSSRDSLNARAACEDAQYRAASEDEVTATHNKPAVSVLSETEPGMSGHSSRTPKFTCDFCQRVFTRKNNFITHVNSHSGKPYLCELCGYKTTNKSDYVRHTRTHTGEKPYSCNVCSFKCTKKWGLDSHVRIHTGEKPYSCEICSYKFTVKCNLDRHMKTHTGEKPHSCKICSYKCAQKSSLDNHMRLHSAEKPYSCDICGYKHALKGRLVYHMKTHSAGEKTPTYTCEICNYKCPQKGRLLSHIRTHTGEKPFTCKLCSYECSQKGALVYHMRRHTGEKPYSCEICNHKFTVKCNLLRHMKTHTGDKTHSSSSKS